MTCFRLILIKDEIKVAVRAIRLDLQSLLEEWVGLVAGRVRKQVKLGEEGAAVWSLDHDVDVLPILARDHSFQPVSTVRVSRLVTLETVAGRIVNTIAVRLPEVEDSSDDRLA